MPAGAALCWIQSSCRLLELWFRWVWPVSSPRRALAEASYCRGCLVIRARSLPEPSQSSIELGLVRAAFLDRNPAASPCSLPPVFAFCSWSARHLGLGFGAQRSPHTLVLLATTRIPLSLPHWPWTLALDSSSSSQRLPHSCEGSSGAHPARFGQHRTSLAWRWLDSPQTPHHQLNARVQFFWPSQAPSNRPSNHSRVVSGHPHTRPPPLQKRLAQKGEGTHLNPQDGFPRGAPRPWPPRPPRHGRLNS